MSRIVGYADPWLARCASTCRASGRRWAAAVGLALSAWICQPVRGDETIPAEPPPRYWRGNLHTHTLWSDGNDFPEMVVEWYRSHGYQFLALSDHNTLSEGPRWLAARAIEERGGTTVIDKYVSRFGEHWVERRTATGSSETEFRLKPLNEFRALMEERGRFILLQSEEISDAVQGKPLHLNATNVRELLNPLGGASIQAALQANLRAAEAQANRYGTEILVHLNHPNYHYAITAADLAAVTEERFFEIYNGHPDVHHEGDATHDSVERLWDVANTLRLTAGTSPPLLGVATDDSHSYHRAEGSTPGRGWVMVRARHLTPESLLRALKRGDFYASSGVTLKQVEIDSSHGRLTVVVEPEAGESYHIRFVGSRKQAAPSTLTSVVDTPTTAGSAADATSAPNPTVAAADIGRVLQESTGTQASYELQPLDVYVRAVVTSSAAHPNPSFPQQRKQAWTQPLVPAAPDNASP